MGSAIQQLTWGEVASLTWDNLLPHQWYDFRLFLQEYSGEIEAQGVSLFSNNKSTVEAVAEAVKIQGIRVEFGLLKMTNEVEIIVSTSISKKDYFSSMMSYMPLYHHEARITNELLKLYAAEFKRLEFEVNDQEENQFIDSAISKIDRWEKGLGITPDKNKTYDYRRERIKLKLLTAGTATKKLIKDIAASFKNGEVEVVENNENYSFAVKFISKGIPEDMDYLRAILEYIKPAHLAIEYDYIYSTWSLLLDRTWGEAALMTWEEFQLFD